MKGPPGMRRMIEDGILEVVGMTPGITRDEIMSWMMEALDEAAGRPWSRKAKGYFGSAIPEVLDKLVRDGRLTEDRGGLYR